MRLRRAILILAVAMSGFLLCELLARGWIKAFLRPGDQDRYLCLFFILLSVFLLLGASHIRRAPMPTLLVVGAIIGQITSMFAVLLYGLLLPNGPERLLNSIQFGWTAMLTVNTWGGFVLGGWLIGATLFGAAKLVLVRFERA
jgi:hypothetical protein